MKANLQLRRALSASRQARLLGFTELEQVCKQLAAITIFHDNDHKIVNSTATRVEYRGKHDGDTHTLVLEDL